MAPRGVWRSVEGGLYPGTPTLQVGQKAVRPGAPSRGPAPTHDEYSSARYEYAARRPGCKYTLQQAAPQAAVAALPYPRPEPPRCPSPRRRLEQTRRNPPRSSARWRRQCGPALIGPASRLSGSPPRRASLIYRPVHPRPAPRRGTLPVPGPRRILDRPCPNPCYRGTRLLPRRRPQAMPAPPSTLW
jgi:hypothetical protein